MKKFLLMIAVALYSTLSFADGNAIILKGTLQQGGTSVISLMMKNEGPVKTAQAFFEMPAGFTLVSTVTTTDIATNGNQVGNEFRFVIAEGKDASIPASDEYVEVAKVTIAVDETVALGSCDVPITSNVMARYPDNASISITAPATCELTVQRAAVLTPIDENNDLEIIPFSFEPNVAFDDYVEIPIYMKSEQFIKGLEFDFELPAGIVPANEWDDDEEDYIYVEPTISNNKGAVSAEISSNDDGTYHFSLSGSGTKYIYAKNVFTEAATLPLMSGAIAPGVYTLKLKNIELTTKADTYTGEYYATIVVGDALDTDPILYGHFTDEAMGLLDQLKGAKTVDMSVATVDDEAQATVNDALVYVGGKTKYSRAKGTSKYGTICLPIDLTSDENIQYYTISDATGEALTLSAAETVPANTPAIFEYKSDEALDASAEATVYAVAPEAGDAIGMVTLTGVYETYPLPVGAGYYIAGDKFWNDGATVKPYRAFLDGSIAGVKALRIQIEDETGIRDITDELDSDAIYDLSGRKLDKVRKGVNIVSGKKILVK